jgi:hypothetical protein
MLDPVLRATSRTVDQNPLPLTRGSLRGRQRLHSEGKCHLVSPWDWLGKLIVGAVYADNAAEPN